jgi:hypothetical protein
MQVDQLADVDLAEIRNASATIGAVSGSGSNSPSSRRR